MHFIPLAAESEARQRMYCEGTPYPLANFIRWRKPLGNDTSGGTGNQVHGLNPGDPPDMATNVTVHVEIINPAKLPASEFNYEIQLQSQRPDPVATHAGENVPK